MKRHEEHEVLTEDLRAHPAVEAWATATSLQNAPESIHVLRERRRKALYLLPGVGEEGTAVFAKRGVAASMTIERTVYEQILPQLPLTTPRYYGSCVTEHFGWLFVEDVGDERYSSTDRQHLELAARWVATLHVGASRVVAARSLPDGGPARYLGHLRAGRDKILAGLRNWRFPAHEVCVLDAVLAHCDAIEARWARVYAGCDGAPATVVHGDFRPKNAFLRSNGGGLSLFPIDWETAGWGFPTLDLTTIDLDAYWSVVRHAWPEMGFDTVQRLARMGRLFAALAALEWESETLKSDNVVARSDAVTSLASVLGRLPATARATRVLE